MSESLRPFAQKLAGLPGRLIPYSVLKPVLYLALNRAFRQPLYQGEMDHLQGAKVRIRVTDLSIDWLVRIDKDRITPVHPELNDDVCISGKSPDFLLLAARQADPDTLFFQRRIRIEGDTALGLGVKNTIDSIDWDDLPTPLRILLQGIGPVIARAFPRERVSGSARATCALPESD